ncbi:MAG: RNA pseudouridine synthase [Gammaproteobacteria bacterium]|nr:RNA pseudouridine synthase [Gammaproteobacteria bacterium]
MPETHKSKNYIVPPCAEQVEILLEDESFLLVNKPRPLLSVPGRHPLNKDCLITRLQKQYPTARIVHRLDMNTSGIMVIALNTDSHRHLSMQFEQRNTYKEYVAVVYGVVEEDTGSIELPLICDWPNRPKQMVDHQVGKPALTHFEVLHRGEDQTRLLFKPLTGRSHQLRVHAAEIGHPILGCRLYAHPKALAMSQRLMLHASKLEFDHPLSNERVKGFCEVPF